MTATTTQATTTLLDVPGAKLAYDIRRNDASTEPPLFLIGSPMAAPGFGTLSGYFADRTIVTYRTRSGRPFMAPDDRGVARRPIVARAY